LITFNQIKTIVRKVEEISKLLPVKCCKHKEYFSAKSAATPPVLTEMMVGIFFFLTETMFFRSNEPRPI